MRLVVVFAVLLTGGFAYQHTLTQSGKSLSGYCYSYFDGGSEWCWTRDSNHKYATSNCASYNGYNENWCYNPPAPASGEDTTGTGARAAGASSAEQKDVDTGGNWKCKAGDWYADGAPTDSEAKLWTMGTNVFRCMHDVQFAKWSNPVADNIKGYLAPLKTMAHSDSYSVKAPAGPAGENLFWGSGSYSPGDAIKSWYAEVKNPGCSSFPGCGGSFNHGTGHLTALVWAGVSKIGCTSNSHGLKACRYKGSDSFDCTTPNMGGCYEANVPKATRSFSTCKAHVKECFGEEPKVDYSRLFDLGDYKNGESFAPPGSVSALMVTAVMVAVTASMVAAWGISAKCRRARQNKMSEEAAENLKTEIE